MQGLSKPFYLASTVGSLALMVVLMIVSLTAAISGNRGVEGVALLAFPLLLYCAVVMFVLFYKMWAAIQDGHARTTPGKAVGFLLIPFFNIYWAFQAIWGWAKDYNAYVARHGLNAPKMPENLFLMYVIFCFTTWIPILGILLLLANFVIAAIMISKICDGVNALPAGPMPAPSPTLA